jgi:hypothetical protein
LDHAAGFLTNLSGFLIALAVLAGFAFAAFRRPGASPPIGC